MDLIPYPVEKYTYYVQRLLLNDPTTEPTEFITAAPSFVPTLSPSFVPTPSVLSSTPHELQYILETSVNASVKASIITSVITTYFVFFFSYCCIVLRAKLKRRYLNNIYSSSHSSRSDSTCTSEGEPFWFNDVYNESEECTENIA